MSPDLVEMSALEDPILLWRAEVAAIDKAAELTLQASPGRFTLRSDDRDR